MKKFIKSKGFYLSAFTLIIIAVIVVISCNKLDLQPLALEPDRKVSSLISTPGGCKAPTELTSHSSAGPLIQRTRRAQKKIADL